MPRVNWGVDSSTIDDFDRSKQYKPYTGPLPENGVYQWSIKSVTAVAKTRDKNPQLRVVLQLVPRYQEETRYKGYTVLKFIIVAEHIPFNYVPFCDAIGVSGEDFTRRTIVDEQGNVKKIGSWRNDGKTMILAQLQSNRGESADEYPKEIGWIGPLEEESEDYDNSEEEEYEEEDGF